MRGTGYAIVEIIWWLLVATAIGFAIGWTLRKWFLSTKTEEEYEGLRTEEEGKRGELRLELEDWKSKAAGFSADVASRDTELNLRTADLDRANAQIIDRDKRMAEMEAGLKTGRSNVRKLEGQIADRESTIAALRSDAGGSEGAVALLRRDLDSANGTIGSLRKDTAGYQATIASLRTDLEAANRKGADLAGRIDSSTSEAATTAAALAASRGTEESLQARLTELEAGAENTAEQQRKLTDLEAQLATMRQERDSATARLRDVEARHAECEDRLATAAGAVAPIAAPPEVGDLPERDAAMAKVAEIATRTRGAGPAVEDDLKKIHGVGPKLESLLKGMDITSFRQVASFTQDDIQYVTAALDAFPGRIERDDWMSSAAAEHSTKYGEPV